MTADEISMIITKEKYLSKLYIRLYNDMYNYIMNITQKIEIYGGFVMKRNDKNEQSAKKYLSSGISLGLCFGVAYGIIFDNLAIGIGIGLCFGTAFGTITQNKNDDHQKDKDE